MANPRHQISPDPFTLGPRILNKLRTLWVSSTYPFISIGKNFRIHFSCDLKRSVAGHTKFGDSVWLDRGTWLNIPEIPQTDEPIIIIEDGCKIGREVQISAKNRIHLERNVMVAGHVLITDHNHAFEDVTLPIMFQGITEGGTIRIEQGAWVGFGVVIICSQGELVIGQNSIIGSNSVVNRSIPPFSIVSGNPARIVKQFDPKKEAWELGARASVSSARG